jgi:hypothetical protein
MRAAKKVVRKKASVRVSASCKPVDAEQMRQKVRNMVANQAYEMTRSMIGEVIEGGSVPAMRYLFELAGLHPVNLEMEQPEERDSLAKTLLERLGLPEPGGEPQPM